FLLYLVEVGLFKADLLAGTLTSGLFAGLARPADDSALPKGIEAMHQDGAKSAAVRDEQCDRDDPPDDSHHGEKAAHLAAGEGVPGVDADLFQHRLASSLVAQGFDGINRCCAARGIDRREHRDCTE